MKNLETDFSELLVVRIEDSELYLFSFIFSFLFSFLSIFLFSDLGLGDNMMLHVMVTNCHCHRMM